MARKKKPTTQPFLLKFIVVTLLVAGIGFGISRGLIHLFRNAEYFRIRSVTIDSSLEFIDKRDLRNLIGKNIFEVDLKSVQRQLRYKYPQAAELKLMKHFPNQIAVVAKERLPFAQIRVKTGVAVLDEDGVMLSAEEKEDKGLPLIAGTKEDTRKLARGLSFKGTDIQTALKIIKLFRSEKTLSSYSIVEINVLSLSKIEMTLSNDLNVILDREDNAQRVRVLGVVLAQGDLDLKHVKYVDLRFKEPIIGKK